MEDEVRDDHPQPAGRQRSGHAEKNCHVVLQHLLPDAMRRREVASLKRDALHPREHLIGGEAGLDRERLDRRLQKS